MKKLLCLLTVMSMSAAFGFNAAAADKEKGEPDVIVDGSKIIFSDQNAQIIDGITLVPARGVFQAMGCDVEWDDTDRTVTVTSSTGVRYVKIVIDSDVMQISTYKNLMEREDYEYSLEVPAQIINDRTMIPLRAVSEAFNCDITWDADLYTVNILTGEPILLDGFTYTAPSEDEMVRMSLFADVSSIKSGDEFEVYINVTNFPAESTLSGIVATFEYDKDKFEYVSGHGTLINDNGDSYDALIGKDNPEYEKGAKIFYMSLDYDKQRTKDGNVYKCIFKSINGESGTIALSNDYTPKIGYESYLMFNQNSKNVGCKGKDIIIDKTPLTIGE